MNKSLKKKWVKALCSGDYKQGVGKLWNAKNNGYCCLGVLAVLDGGREEFFLHDCGYAPNCNLSWDVQRQLSRLNDAKVPFEVIAGFIQENVEAS